MNEKCPHEQCQALSFVGKNCPLLHGWYSSSSTISAISSQQARYFFQQQARWQTLLLAYSLYNLLYSIVLTHANLAPPPCRNPQTVHRVSGQIYHNFGSLQPPLCQQPINPQIHILDLAKASWKHTNGETA